jgi:hypothetical protein
MIRFHGGDGHVSRTTIRTSNTSSDSIATLAFLGTLERLPEPVHERPLGAALGAA